MRHLILGRLWWFGAAAGVAMLASAADVHWTGNDDGSTWSLNGNWRETFIPAESDYARIPGNSDISLSSEGTLVVGRLYLGYITDDPEVDSAEVIATLTGGTFESDQLFVADAAGSVATLNISGGTYTVRAGGDPGFGVGVGLGSTGTVNITGGKLSVTSANSNIGRYGTGVINQSGGTIEHTSWFALGRLNTTVDGVVVDGEGIYNFTGGNYVGTSASHGVIVGEYGKATLNISGTANMDLAGRLSINGYGTVNLMDGGKITANYIQRQNTYGTDSAINFDGGTLAMGGTTLIRDPYIPAEIAHLYVNDGGAKLEISEGHYAAINNTFTKHPDATADGGLTKTGDGALVLNGSADYEGPTVLSAGTLVLSKEDSIPSIAEEDFTIAPGTTVGFGLNNWSEAATAALIARINGAYNIGLGLDTNGGSAEFDDAIALTGSAGLAKTGNNTLTLTGANTYTGDTVIWKGLLHAAKGVGIPNDSHIRLAGGGWAPINESPMTRSIGEGAADISVDEGQPLSLAAVDAPLTVDIGGEAAALNVTEKGITTLRLNDTGANAPLTFANPVIYTSGALNIEANSSDANAAVVMAGEISGTTSHLVKTGPAAISFDGGFSIPNQWVQIYDGPAYFTNSLATYHTHDYRIYNAAKLYVTDGVKLTTSGGWFYSGAAGTGSETHLESGSSIDMGSGRFIAAWESGTTSKVYVEPGSDVQVGLLIVGNYGVGEMIQNGGTVHDTTANGGDAGIGEYNKNDKLVGHGIYRLNDGVLQVDNNFQIGRYGIGEVFQTGGAASCSEWFSIARYAGSVGTWNISGGTLTQPNSGRAIIVGEDGTGTLNVSGDGRVYSAAPVRLANSVVTQGATLNVTDGGRVEATSFNFGATTNTLVFYVDNATLAPYNPATEENPDPSGVFANFFNGNDSAGLSIGPGGVTIDTGANSVYSYGIPVANGRSTGAITKTGSGLLALGTVPSVDNLNVAEGTLSIHSGSGGLVHRWSFNGTAEDSVGDKNAYIVGNCAYSEDGKQICLNAGTHFGGYVNLGSDILPSDNTPVTIELWATLREVRSWSKMFCFSSSGENGLLMTFCTGGATQNTSINVLGKSNNETGTGTVDLNAEYYYAVTIKPDGAGNTSVEAVRKDVATGATLGSRTINVSNWTTSEWALNYCFLGATHEWGDADAMANYNEVRVWNRVFTDAELTQNVLYGPDRLPAYLQEDTVKDDNVFPDEPSAELLQNNYLTHRWPFNNSYSDVIGGADAIPQGQVRLDSGKAAQTSGGNKGTSSINLGTDILPTEGPVTIEFWGRQNVARTWSQAFAFGSSTSDYLAMGWRGGVDPVAGLGFFCVNNKGNFPVSDCAEGVTYHFGCVVIPDGAGGSDVTLYQQDAGTGETIAAATQHYDDWTIANLKQAHCVLGRSEFGDPDASATYFEFRVWNAGLSEAQLTENAVLGTDALPKLSSEFVETVRNVNVAAGATLDLNGDTHELFGLSGAGRVYHGTLNVKGVLSPGGDDAIGTLNLALDTVLTGTLRVAQGDLLLCEGSLDLTNAKLEFTSEQLAGGSYTFATTSVGTISGTFAETNLPDKYTVVLSADKKTARIILGGTLFMVR
ncbi:MAG: autotransporter-associated beta strand repeat-containing protein [Kiritimatiellae bacterium]|nr:autotransporter-associated beta strand repeat-containing protein [Kiritimatiellia bacterium]